VGTIAAYLLFDLSFPVALVLGSVLVVSGPTVVGPLLKFIRPSKTVASILMWEGTFADPLGATLGVVVFNAVLAGHAHAGQEVAHFLSNIAIGAGFGLAGGVLVLAWARWFKPSPSQAVTGTLMFVVAAVVGADLLRDDTGLITGLVIGAILVNRPPTRVEPRGAALQSAKLRVAWRERIATLTTFLIGMLFVILSARVTPHQIATIGWVSLAFVAVLVLIGRPLAVALSTLGSTLQIRERAFIAWMAPRGIVAAATSSTFALGLSQAGIGGGAQNLIPITFIVIAATALIYGLSGAPVARALGVARTGPGGLLLVGGTRVGRMIGRALHDRGLSVVLWTASDKNARAVEGDGLAVYRGNPIADATAGAPSDLDEIDYALIVGDDEALCAMAATDLSEYFGRDRVFQLPAKDGPATDFLTRVALLFDTSANHDALLARLEAGAEIAVASAPPAVSEEPAVHADPAALPLFVHTPGKNLRILTAGDEPALEIGQELIVLTGHP
jgi:NhaP-type Na+/H+ or K+/H+ antiporter